MGQRGRRREELDGSRRAVTLFGWQDPGLGKMGRLQGFVSSHGTQAPRGVFRTPRDLRAGPVFAVCLLQETGGPAGSHLLFPQPRLPRVESAADGG